MTVGYARLQLRDHPRRVGGGRGASAGAAAEDADHTPAYDADVAKFFRTMGQGYQARMNAVLRAYMLAILSRADREPEEHGLEGGRDLRRGAVAD